MNPVYIAGGSILANLILFGLWQGAKEDLVRQTEKANTEKVRYALEKEGEVKDALNAAHAEELAERDRMAKATQDALAAITAVADSAQDEIAEKNGRIQQLELEADFDEIPDSGECLNVYVPGGLLLERDCASPGNSGSREGGACRNIGQSHQTYPAFSAVTYSQLAEAFNHNTAGLEQCNAQLAEIRALGQQH